MAQFSVRTLGFPEIRRDGRPCRLALRKGLALLIYLAETKGPVGRDVAVAMLWPEDSDVVVRARLRRLLHRLQLSLGDDVLTIDRSTVRWSSAIDLHVDSQAFEQACDRGEFEAACRLYLGGFLEGFSPGDCPQFDEWSFFRREALRGRAIQALERVVHDKNAACDYGPRPHTPAVSLSSIRSAKSMAATSSAIYCSPEIVPSPSATLRP